MTGIAFLTSRTPEARHHGSLAVHGLQEPELFDFIRSYRRQKRPADSFGFALYWPIEALQAHALLLALEQALSLSPDRIRFQEIGHSAQPAAATAAAFKAAMEGRPGDPVYVNCITALTNILLYAGIDCPLLDLSQITRCSHIADSVQKKTTMPNRHWQDAGQGLVWHNPHGQTPYRPLMSGLTQAMWLKAA